MIENTKQIQDILAFYNCPCDVSGVRNLSMFTDYILNPINGTTIKKLQARVADFSMMIGAAVQVLVDNGLLIFRIQTGKAQTLDYFSYVNNLNRGGGYIALGLNPDNAFMQDNIYTMPILYPH